MIELHFSRTNGPADRAIDHLMNLVGGIRRPEIVREMILAALKAGQEDDERADLKLINTTLKEMRFTSKVFGPYREVRKVTVFGSARTQPHEPAYKMARLFGRKLSESGYMVITGGGPGIMQAANEGAGTEHSFGVSIRLPFEQKSNPILDGHPRNIMYKYFFNRKVAFLKQSDAIALFPGGFGTLDELFEALTLVQTRKAAAVRIFVVGKKFYKPLIKFMKTQMVEEGMIDAEDLDLITVTDDLECIVKEIEASLPEQIDELGEEGLESTEYYKTLSEFFENREINGGQDSK